jgi:hypothetical protein
MSLARPVLRRRLTMKRFQLVVLAFFLVAAVGTACGGSGRLAPFAVQSMLMIDRNPVSPLHDVVILLSSADLSSSCSGATDAGVLQQGTQYVEVFLESLDPNSGLVPGSLPFSNQSLPNNPAFTAFVERQDVSIPYSTFALSFGEGANEVDTATGGTVHLTSVAQNRIMGELDATVADNTNGKQTSLSGSFDAQLCVSVP